MIVDDKNILKAKSFKFAIRIVNLYKYLCGNKNEFVLSKQLLRCGTSVGAMVHEAEHAESRADFVHKMAVAQKEINEAIYWIELLKETEYITLAEYNNIQADTIELIKLITSSIKTSKKNG